MSLLLCCSYEYGSVRPPDQQFIKNLFEDLKSWEETLNQEAEHFTGETLLTREEELLHMSKEVDGWTDVALKVENKNRVTKQTNKRTDEQTDRQTSKQTNKK